MNWQPPTNAQSTLWSLHNSDNRVVAQVCRLESSWWVVAFWVFGRGPEFEQMLRENYPTLKAVQEVCELCLIRHHLGQL